MGLVMKAHPVHTRYSADELGQLCGPSGVLKGSRRSSGRNPEFRTIDLREGRKGARCAMLVHRFVFECFNGLIDGKDEIVHLDGDRTNNTLSNLRRMSQRAHRQIRPPRIRKRGSAIVVDGTRPHPNFEGYSAAGDGSCFGPSGKAISGARHLGYRRLHIGFGGKQVGILRHRFVYECFHGLLDARFEVDHIDSNKSNNALSNLQALTPTAHRLKTQITVVRSGTRKIASASLGEIWACPRFGAGYEVSTHGRFRGMTRRLTEGSLSGPYRGVMCRGKAYKAHVLVALTFLGPRPSEGSTVDHIDRNPLNNRLDNLRWSDKYQQAANSSQATAVQAFRANGDSAGIWPTKGAAGRATGTYSSNITKVLKGEIAQTGGLTWSLVD